MVVWQGYPLFNHPNVCKETNPIKRLRSRWYTYSYQQSNGRPQPFTKLKKDTGRSLVTSATAIPVRALSVRSLFGSKTSCVERDSSWQIPAGGKSWGSRQRSSAPSVPSHAQSFLELQLPPRTNRKKTWAELTLTDSPSVSRTSLSLGKPIPRKA